MDCLQGEKVICTSEEKLQETVRVCLQKELEEQRNILVREISAELQRLLFRGGLQLLRKVVRKFRNILLGILFHLPLLFLGTEEYESYRCMFLSARRIYQYKRNRSQTSPAAIQETASGAVRKLLSAHTDEKEAIEQFIEDVQMCKDSNALLCVIRKMAEEHPELRARAILSGREILTRMLELSSIVNRPKSMSYFQRKVSAMVKACGGGDGMKK